MNSIIIKKAGKQIKMNDKFFKVVKPLFSSVISKALKKRQSVLISV